MVERWVIIATERARRPMDFAPEVVLPNGPEGCPFCPGHEDRTPPELFRSGGSDDGPWTVRVVPNKFPALHADVEVHSAGEGIYDRMDGVGAHEVVIESPDHFAGLGTLPVAHVGEVLVAYRERLLALRKDTRLEYVLIFKNHGVAAGASLEHPHSQLIATPILPELVAEELAGGDSLLPHEGALRLVRHRPPGAARWEPSRPGGRRLHRRGAVRLPLPLRDVDPADRSPGQLRGPHAGRGGRASPGCSGSWSAGSAGCSRIPRTTSRSIRRPFGTRTPSTSTGTSSSCRS